MRPTEVIFLTRRDTIDTACALLRRARSGAQVWLVVPWRAKLLRELINLKRLKRVATDAAIDLRLVSRHLETRGLAHEVGLPVSFFLPWRLKKYRPREIRTTDLGKRVVPVQESLSPRLERGPRNFTPGRALLALLLIAMLMGSLLGVVLFFLPTAQVVLEPVANPEQVVFTARANPRYRQIGYEETAIPARVMQVIVQGQGETPATGRRDVPEQHASGFVVLTNRTDQPLTVARGTIVRTSSGTTVRFYTTNDVELPGGVYAHVRVPVIAADPGYVVAPAFTVNRMEGELATRVEVLNDNRIEGGSTRRVPVVTYSDLDTLRSMLVTQIQQEAYDQFIQQMEPGEFVPVDSIDVEIMSLEYAQVVDEQSDMLSGQMRLVVRGIVVNENHLRDMGRWLLLQQAGGDKQVIEDSLVVVRTDNIRATDEWIEVEARAQGMVASVVDMDQVKSAIRGRQVEKAVAWLVDNLPLEGPPHISVTPSSWERLPLLSERTDIVIASPSP